MNLIFIGFSLDFIGKMLVALTALSVHHRFWQEHKIDRKVFASMRREQMLGMLGIVLIMLGYIIQVPSKI